jgi:hypothetical protein
MVLLPDSESRRTRWRRYGSRERDRNGKLDDSIRSRDCELKVVWRHDMDLRRMVLVRDYSVLSHVVCHCRSGPEEQGKLIKKTKIEGADSRLFAR